MRPLISMRALNGANLFASILKGESWASWRVLLMAIVGEELTSEEGAIFESLTGRPQEPREPVEEFWAIIAADAPARRAPWRS